MVQFSVIYNHMDFVFVGLCNSYLWEQSLGKAQPFMEDMLESTVSNPCLHRLWSKIALVGFLKRESGVQFFSSAE